MFEALFAAFALLATVAVIPNRLIELVKPSIQARFPADAQENLRLFIILALSLLASLATAVVLNFNIFTGFPDNPYLSQIPPLVGVLGTGVLLMFGANVWHELGERVEPPPVVETQTKTETTTTVTANTQAAAAPYVTFAEAERIAQRAATAAIRETYRKPTSPPEAG